MKTQKPKPHGQRVIPLNTTRETLPSIEPTYTAQTIIINSPNCNIKYVHQGNIKFQTVEKAGRQNRSVLQIPVEGKQRGGERARDKGDYSNWVSNRNLREVELV